MIRRATIIPLSIFIFVVLVHGFLVTQGTGALVARELRSDSYDSLGDSLLLGQSNVKPETVNWEGLDMRGKKYMYWGPFPALPRILLNKLWPAYWGQWARITSLMASILALLGFLMFADRALKANSNLTRKDTVFYRHLLFVGFGLGTPLLYLISSGRIYHEAITWALAGSTWAVLGIFAVLHHWYNRRVAFSILSFGAGVALLSRVTFGAPLYLVLGILSVREILCGRNGSLWGVKLRRCAALSVALMPALVAGLFQTWYNFDRFQSLLTFMDYTYCYLHPDTFGGVLNARRIPRLMDNYFGFHWAYFLSHLPFVQMVTVNYTDDSLFYVAWKEQAISLSVSSPWLVLGGVMGSIALLRVRNIAALLSYGALLLQALLILSFWSATQRYATELLPWLLFGLGYFAMTTRRPTFLKKLGFIVVILMSVVATSLSTVSWHAFYASPADVSPQWQARLVELFSPPNPLPGWDGRRMYVDEMPRHETFSFMAPKIRGTEGNMEFSWGEIAYPHAIWVHANTTMQIEVPPETVGFESIVGIPQEATTCPKASLRFSVLDDAGKTLFQSGIVAVAGARLADGSIAPETTPLIPVRIAVHSTRHITLVTDDGGNGRDCDHGVWFMPALLLPKESD